MDSYCYVPFGTEPECHQFRILTLLPGSRGQPLECILKHGDIGNSPPYEAISYVWGDTRDKVNIICNGKPLIISANLDAVLRHFRFPSDKRTLWVDAVCINQNDDEERGRQVGRMKDIYSKAMEVLIWLGEEGEDSDAGITVASDIAQACRQYISGGGSLETISFNESPVQRLFGRFRDKSEFTRLEAFAKIIKRLWFTRVWVVQELALATKATVFCGNSSISWTDLMNAITAQDYLNLWLADHERNAYVFILERARQEWNAGVRRSLLSILFRYRILDATDPRDKIFGLNALIKNELPGGQALQPNYNVDATELYIAVAKEILKQSSDLNLLSVPRRLSGDGPGPKNLPSWVPDWTNTRLTAPLGLANYSDINELAFSASGSSTPQIEFGGVDSSSLGVQGCCVDRIAAVGTVLRLEDLPRTDYHGTRIPKCAFVLDDWSRVAKLRDQNFYFTGPEPYLTGEPMRDAFVQTLVTESTNESIETLRQQLDILERNAAIAKWLNFLPKRLPSWLTDKAVYLAHAILFCRRNDQMTLDFRIHLSSLADRRGFRTDKGYIGLGSALAEVGDKIVVVKGAKLPLILRAAGSQWTVQGDCFVKGIMQGEAYHEEETSQMWIV
ncbi:HET-domain-containing protein [Annulohypoxylon maeteangense]|uniref:HET-domain-containing protein n=1 Tax=Annulohypoxylon maeteangense TaxID=1927788 RepID=UPI0020086536|nr:HET-domain-containing protein [Annulohypoxylon maeteangense]KAI0881513.1 HET-domain-containing protein [Annulohypoxylon maeteangense]